MPYAAGAFLMFGLGSMPAGRFGDHWGRRSMMLVFLFGTGATCLLAAATQNAWQMAAVLTLLGAFASIYHPVGIPMLVQGTTRPGAVIGVNGLVGNLGIAAAAVLTGLTVKFLGWRMAFVIPGLLSLAFGLVFARLVPQEDSPPAKRAPKQSDLPRSEIARVDPDPHDHVHLRQPGLQLPDQRQRRAHDRPPARGDRESRGDRRAARPGVRDRVVRAARRRPRDRPLPAEAAVPGDHAGADAAVRARDASPRAGCSTRSPSRSWRSCSVRFPSPTRSSSATSTTACARAWRACASPSRSACRRRRCGCWARW